MVATPEVVPWELGWPAISAFAASLAALAQPFIVWQIFKARQAHVDGITERGLAALAPHRVDVLALTLKAADGRGLDVDDLKVLRRCFVAHDLALPAIAAIIRYRMDPSGIRIVDSYLNDLGKLLSLTGSASTVVRQKLDKFSTEIDDAGRAALASMGMTKDEQDAIIEAISGADHEKAGNLVRIAIVRIGLESGKTTQEIELAVRVASEQSGKQDAKASQVAIEDTFFARFGGDIGNQYSLRAWMDEIREMHQVVGGILVEVNSLFSNKMKWARRFQFWKKWPFVVKMRKA